MAWTVWVEWVMEVKARLIDRLIGGVVGFRPRVSRRRLARCRRSSGRGAWR